MAQSSALDPNGADVAPGRSAAVNTAAPAEEWLTAAQVAAHFQVNPRTVYRWAAADPQMRVKRLGPDGRTLRIHASELERDGNGRGTPTA